MARALPDGFCRPLSKLATIRYIDSLLFPQSSLNYHTAESVIVFSDYKSVRRNARNNADMAALSNSQNLPTTPRQDLMMNTIQDVIWLKSGIINRSLLVGHACHHLVVA